MRRPDFLFCHICDHYHPWGFAGDCRDNNNRFTIDDIDEMRDRLAATGSEASIIVEETEESEESEEVRP